MDNYYNSEEFAEKFVEQGLHTEFSEKIKRIKLNVFEDCYQWKGEILIQLWRASKTKMI